MRWILLLLFCIQFNAYADVNIDSREQSNVTPILPHNEMDKKINRENSFTPYSFEDAWLNGDFLKPYSVRAQYMLIPVKDSPLSANISKYDIANKNPIPYALYEKNDTELSNTAGSPFNVVKEMDSSPWAFAMLCIAVLGLGLRRFTSNKP